MIVMMIIISLIVGWLVGYISTKFTDNPIMFIFIGLMAFTVAFVFISRYMNGLL